MSQRVSDQEQGKLQGANGSIASIAGLIGPALFTQSFAYCISKTHGWTLPGAPYFLAALLLVVALLLSLQVARPVRSLSETAA
jgi:DHA1 family tetracycline resistance protein-like MFS transporter